MGQDVHISKPTKINRDIDPKYLPADSAFYMLNNERSVNADGTLGKNRPLAGSELICSMAEMINDPWCVMAYKSELTNEVYFAFINNDPEGKNYILRINPDATCEIVYEGDCLTLSAAPEHKIEDWRCYMKYDKICAHRHGKQLIFCDGSDNPIWMIDTEASIATNNFTTDFFDICPDECAMIQMCVPERCGALEGEFVPLEEDQVDLANNIIDKGIQLRVRFVYYDGRAGEWGDISDLFYLDSKGCFDESQGLPRCLKLRVPIGNPMVDKIEIAYCVNNGNGETGRLWFRTDTVEKYKPYTSEGQYWYERELADLENFSEEDCSFDYYFCNDKECVSIDINETDRVFNPMPRAPQGLFRIKNTLAFYNYIKGNCPLLQSETEKIELSLNCEDTIGCLEEYVTLYVRAIIYNPFLHRAQYIYRLGGDGSSPNNPDDINDVAYWGGVGFESPPVEISPFYLQGFYPQKRNFTAYIEAYDIQENFKQFLAPQNLPNGQVGGEYGVVSNGEQNSLNDQTGFFLQVAKIKVKKGTRGFIRITNHLSNDGLGNNQNKSTQVLGTIDTLDAYNGNKDISGDIHYLRKELFFDTCDNTTGEMFIDETFVIQDNIGHNLSGIHSSTAFSGYITDNANKPVEGAEVRYAAVKRAFTDHNGYYNFALYGDDNSGDSLTVAIRVETDCGAFTTIQFATFSGGYGGVTYTDVKIINTTYENNDYEIVRVAIKDCDNNPVPGIRVALSGTKYKVTEAITGEAVFHVRNYFTRDRAVRAVVINNNYCIALNCEGNCSPCMPMSALVTLPACFSGHTTSFGVDGFINISSASISLNGLKAGGRYPWGVLVQGDCGRISSVYPITILDGSIPVAEFMNIPKTQAKSGLSFCNISYDLNGFIPPDWGKCLKLVRGKNLNPYVLQWIVDSIIRTNDNKIILTIQSLNDFNAKYNFETNTSYQYLKNDRVEFISNGDGHIFDIATYGLLNYLILNPFKDTNISDSIDINFFNQIIIEDDGKLSALQPGAKIEIQRPGVCEDDNMPYFEIGLSLAIVNISGVPTVINPTGTFKTFDTYFVYRSIGNIAPQIFESQNPSDFWGDKLNGISDIGKVHFKNRYENEKRFGRNVTLNTENQFNRFGDFEKTFDAPEQGDLISVGTYDGKIGLGIGENDSFLFRLSDDFLRLGSDGIVRAAPVDSIISDADPKVSGIFGCDYTDIGSIFYGDGYVLWVDSKKNAHVKHDFNSAQDISLDKMKSWFSKKIQRTKALNSASGNPENKFRWITGINNETNAIQLSIKSLVDPDIYNFRDSLLADYETILYDAKSNDYLTNASYVQEAYSNIELYDNLGCAFVSVSKGNVWRHPVVPINANTFNGTSCDWIIGIVVNKDPLTVKVALSIEEQSEKMFFVSKVETDRDGFISEIPPIRFNKTERKWNANFLYDKNKQGGLYGTDPAVPGESARGYYIKVTLVRDNTDALIYNSINTDKQKEFSNLDMILVKYMLSEINSYGLKSS